MRYVYLISTLVGIAALAAIVYFIASLREMEPVVIYKTTGFNTSKADPTATTDAPPLDTENNAQPRANATQDDTAADISMATKSNTNGDSRSNAMP